jgi:hypothetical protein
MEETGAEEDGGRGSSAGFKNARSLARWMRRRKESVPRAGREI